MQSAAEAEAIGRLQQALGDAGLHLERTAGARGGRGFAGHLSRGVQAGHGRRGRRCSATPEPIIPTTGSADWPARTCTPSRSCSPATTPERERCLSRAPEARSRSAQGVEVLSSLDLEATPPFDYAHDHFGYRDRLSQPVIEGSGDAADARIRRAAQAGRVHPRLSRRGRPSAEPAAARDPLAQRQLPGLPAAAGARGRVSRLPARARQDPRGAGARGGEAHGPLAQRRAAGARAGQGRSGARRGHAAQQRLQLQGNGPARVRGAAWLALPADEPARHGGQHEPAADDSPRRHLRPAAPGRLRRKTASSAASRRS